MKNKIIFFILLWECVLFHLLASSVVEDGVYSISCQQTDGYVALGAYQNVNPYICYVMNGQTLTADAYWVVTSTAKGYTFRNEVSGEYLIYTTGRVDAYYKYMTLSADESDNDSLYWNITEAGDGSLYINSMAKPAYYWNLRASQGLLGTYSGSSRSVNERFCLTKKEVGTAPEPEPETQTFFPAALHVYLTDGRIEAYPLNMVTSHKEVSGQLHIETCIGQTFTYPLADVERVSEDAPTDLPTFESFKFNNKYNDQLFSDCLGEIVEDTVFLTLTAIGKRLTPSFKVTDDQTLVYVNGVLQDSKTSRLRFDEDIYYIVTRPGITMWLPDADTPTTYSMQPYGRIVRVHVDWLTDRAEVPTIYINTADGQAITSKTEYKDATISIDGHGIFPSMDETDLQIRGRGNTSWNWPKKPYRLKFAEKVKPLGMTKGKNWVLLSNYQTGSLMSNAIGMKAANLMGAASANHIVPVDLYLNGEYRGSYNFTEKVGLSNNSVEVADETVAALLELDSYYDEPVGQKFHSTPYNLPINVKEPDFSEGTSFITLNDVETDFNGFASALYNEEDITGYVDLEQLARFLMVNELICNYELYHPKSTFCYKESFLDAESKYIFGPVWDLDWAFGYEGHGRYFQDEATSNYWEDMPFNQVRDFIQDLRFKDSELGNIYNELWTQFMENDLTELLEFCQDYYDFAHRSFEKNRTVWNDNTNYLQQVTTAASWLETRANQIYSDIIDYDKERANVTYDYVYDDQIIYSETIQVIVGKSVPAPSQASNGFINLELISDLPEAVSSDCTISYRVIWNGPFQFTYSLSNAHWYNMTIRSYYYVGKDETEPYYPTSQVDEEIMKQPEYQWAFGGDPLHVKVYNRSTGLDEVLMPVGTDALMRQGDYSWDLLPNSDGFVLREHDTEYSCLNQFGGSSGPLRFWNNKSSLTDNGSTFRIFEAPEIILLGDVNGDGDVDLSDAIMVTYYSLHVAPANFNEAAADMNGDGDVDLSDAISIIYKTLGVK